MLLHPSSGFAGCMVITALLFKRINWGVILSLVRLLCLNGFKKWYLHFSHLCALSAVMSKGGLLDKIDPIWRYFTIFQLTAVSSYHSACSEGDVQVLHNCFRKRVCHGSRFAKQIKSRGMRRFYGKVKNQIRKHTSSHFNSSCGLD